MNAGPNLFLGLGPLEVTMDLQANDLVLLDVMGGLAKSSKLATIFGRGGSVGGGGGGVGLGWG